MSDSSIELTQNEVTADAAGSSVGIATIGDYFSLLKPRVMSLVIFTGLVGLILAPGSVHPITAFTAILCIALGAGASGALNMWYEADIDAGMERTKSRPIPMGRITLEQALTFGSILSFFSVYTMAILVNYLAAGLLAFTILFYAVVYTMWLKRSTPQNIVIGGASGALPPVIGWAAVTGNVTIEPLILFAIIFTWTPPHFWALALFRAGEYEKVGVPMMPVVAGKPSTRRQILGYSVLMAGVAMLPAVLGFAGMVYGIAAAVMSSVFVALAARLWWLGDQPASTKAAARLFGFSIVYLFGLFLVLGLEALFREFM